MKRFQQILEQAGFPTEVLCLDFESFFSADYCMGRSKKAISLIEYVMDQRFEFTGMGEKFFGNSDVDYPINFYEPDKLEMYFRAACRAYGPNLEKCTIVGQNLKFDCLLMAEKFSVVPQYTVDLLDLANMHDPKMKHDLNTLDAYWLGGEGSKGDTNQFKGVHAKNIDYKKMSKYCRNDIDITAKLIQVMLPEIMARPKLEIPLANHTLQMFLHPSFDIDIPRAKIIQQRMSLEMAGAVMKAGKVMGIDYGHEDFSKPTIFVPMFTEILEKYGEVMPMKLSDKPYKKTGKRELIPALAKDDQAMQELLCHPVEEISVLAAAKVAVGSWPGHIKKVKNIVLQAEARGNRLGGSLGYCRAKTWRWGGIGGINQHNMGGRGRAGRGTHPLIIEVRGIYKAPKGYILGIPDLSAIEARNLAWQAGQENMLQAFVKNTDIYSEFGSELFNAQIRRAEDDDPPALAALYTLRRGFSKDCVLGFGYGMGTNRFYHDCYINPALRPLFDSGKYDWEFCDKAVKLYRNKYNKIPDFWDKVEIAWRFVTKFKQEERIVNDNLRFYNKNDATFIELPSGRYIRYPRARVTGKGDLSYKYAKNLWGGYLTENIIQAESRDLLAEAIMRLVNVGYDVVLHVHDEIVLMLKKETAEQDLARAVEIMIEVPTWAVGFLIDAEGILSERYCK